MFCRVCLIEFDQIILSNCRSDFLQLSPEPRGAGALSVGGVAVGVVLAGADLPAVAAEGVDGAGPVAVVASVAGLADAGPAPRMTPERLKDF